MKKISAFFIFFSLLAGCIPNSPTGQIYNQESGCFKTYYAKNKTINLPYFTVEYLGERKENYGMKQNVFLYHDFKIKKAKEEKIISWSSGTGDIGPEYFEFEEKPYTIELQYANTFKKLQNNEIVICKSEKKISPANFDNAIP